MTEDKNIGFLNNVGLITFTKVLDEDVEMINKKLERSFIKKAMEKRKNNNSKRKHRKHDFITIYKNNKNKNIYTRL